MAAKPITSHLKRQLKIICDRIFKKELATQFTERKVTITTSWLEYSVHAITRMAQRGIGREEAEYVRRHGRHIHCGGVLHIFLGKKDIPATDRRNPCIRKLEGTTLIIDPFNTAEVITAYRNKQALKSIRRKAKYCQRP